MLLMDACYSTMWLGRANWWLNTCWQDGRLNSTCYDIIYRNSLPMVCVLPNPSDSKQNTWSFRPKKICTRVLTICQYTLAVFSLQFSSKLKSKKIIDSPIHLKQATNLKSNIVQLKQDYNFNTLSLSAWTLVHSLFGRVIIFTSLLSKFL